MCNKIQKMHTFYINYLINRIVFVMFRKSKCSSSGRGCSKYVEDNTIDQITNVKNAHFVGSYYICIWKSTVQET
jgi:hypothetical protein